VVPKPQPVVGSLQGRTDRVRGTTRTRRLAALTDDPVWKGGALPPAALPMRFPGWPVIPDAFKRTGGLPADMRRTRTFMERCKSAN